MGTVPGRIRCCHMILLQAGVPQRTVIIQHETRRGTWNLDLYIPTINSPRLICLIYCNPTRLLCKELQLQCTYINCNWTTGCGNKIIHETHPDSLKFNIIVKERQGFFKPIFYYSTLSIPLEKYIRRIEWIFADTGLWLIFMTRVSVTSYNFQTFIFNAVCFLIKNRKVYVFYLKSNLLFLFVS